MIRQINAEICWGEKRKNNTAIKTNNTTRGNKLEATGERRKLKKIPKEDELKQTKQGIPKQ